MRAPGETFLGSYSDSQWQLIAAAVRHGARLDADQTKVADRSAPYHRIPLRAALERRFSRNVAPSSACFVPSAKELRQLQTKTEELLESFANSSLHRYVDMAGMIGWDENLAPAALTEISRRLAETTAFVKKIRVRGDYSKSDRDVALFDLWTVWIDLGGQETGKGAETFLQACLEPVFGPTTRKAIARLLERNQPIRQLHLFLRSMATPSP